MLGDIIGQEPLPETTTALFDTYVDLVWPEHNDQRPNAPLQTLGRNAVLDALGAGFAALILTGSAALSDQPRHTVSEGDLPRADVAALCLCCRLNTMRPFSGRSSRDEMAILRLRFSARSEERWRLGNAPFAAAHRDDILFELPFWPDDSQGRAPLVYFSDSGLWHRAFAPFRDPLAIRNVLYDAKAWEGFNVNAFRRLTLSYANCFVWRRDGARAGEIDLVLDWRSGDRWAIEISRDPNKRASPAYAQGVEMVSAVRKLIVRPGAPRLERRMNYEYVDIEGALRFIAEARPANVARASGQ